MSPWLLHCCRTEWLDDTHRTLRAWSNQSAPQGIVVLHWDNVDGHMSRLTDADYPDLRTAIPVLLEEDTVDYLDRLILRLTNELAHAPEARGLRPRVNVVGVTWAILHAGLKPRATPRRCGLPGWRRFSRPSMTDSLGPKLWWQDISDSASEAR